MNTGRQGDKPSGTTKTRIVAGVLSLAQQQGFEATSYQDIATELGISKAAVYHHFPSRGDLADACFSPLLTALETLVAGAESGRVPGGPRRLLECYLETLLTHRPAATALIGDVSAIHHPALEARPERLHDRLTQLLAPDDTPLGEMRATAAVGALRRAVLVLDQHEVERLSGGLIAAALAALGGDGTSPDPPQEPTTVESTSFLPEPTSARAARSFLRDTMKAWNLEVDGPLVALLGNELVTNAVMHAVTRLTLTVRRLPSSGQRTQERLRVEVADADRRLPVLNEDPDSGFGLVLVNSLATAWGTERRAERGKVVWFEVGVPSAIFEGET